MTAPGVVLSAAAPTAKATAWTPLVALSIGLLLVAGLFRLRDTSSDAVVVMGAAGLAAALVLALRDPADALLAPLPVPRLTRRLLRLAWSPRRPSRSGSPSRCCCRAASTGSRRWWR